MRREHSSRVPPRVLGGTPPVVRLTPFGELPAGVLPNEVRQGSKDE